MFFAKSFFDLRKMDFREFSCSDSAKHGVLWYNKRVSDTTRKGCFHAVV